MGIARAGGTGVGVVINYQNSRQRFDMGRDRGVPAWLDWRIRLAALMGFMQEFVKFAGEAIWERHGNAAAVFIGQ